MRSNPLENNRAVAAKVRWREIASAEFRCFFCPPNGGENASRKPRHGAQKARGKNHRG